MRRLIVCADGTWNTPDRLDAGTMAPSNVVKLARAILPVAADGTDQIVLYDAGIGTEGLIDKFSGGAFGIGLSRNVREAYLFLVHNYREGDEIYFFGFSRGAYTVRSTAGMVRKVGILKKPNAGRALEAWNIYRIREGGADIPRAVEFRELWSWSPVPIKFIGVWDTVGALGIPGVFNFLGRDRFQFHDVALSRSVSYAYQALAIDEKRKFFEPTLWEQNPDAEGQVLEQAWFPGVHMDVGGGYRDGGLSDGALGWMVKKATAAGLHLDTEYLSHVSHPNHLSTLHESRNFPYTLIPTFDRPLLKGVPKQISVHNPSISNEVVEEAALKRFREAPSYRPPNLVDLLEEERRGRTAGS